MEQIVITRFSDCNLPSIEPRIRITSAEIIDQATKDATEAYYKVKAIKEDDAYNKMYINTYDTAYDAAFIAAANADK